MNTMRHLIFCLSLMLLGNSMVNAKELVIYHDADYTGHASSAESMAMGFKTALAEVNNRIQGYDIRIVSKDHRGNVKRSKRHMQQFLDDPQALFVLGGLHSPPYLVNLDYINSNKILLMVPWAAAGPITRYAGGTNWVFRLSIDDSKAGIRLAQYAVDKMNCKSPALLLENTGWGKSNHRTLTSSLDKKGIAPSGVYWFEWNTKANSAKLILNEIMDKKSDCILFVGNAIEGEVFTREVSTLPQNKRLPVVSHWGITGGSFHEVFREHLHGNLDLAFLQTCFSFNSGSLNPFAQKVFDQTAQLFNKVNKPEDILAPPGFIHSYDIGKIIIEALETIELTGDMLRDREALRNALEDISNPVQGLVKTYTKPFSAWTQSAADAHEALGLEDFCMASFDDMGIIRLQE